MKWSFYFEFRNIWIWKLERNMLGCNIILITSQYWLYLEQYCFHWQEILLIIEMLTFCPYWKKYLASVKSIKLILALAFRWKYFQCKVYICMQIGITLEIFTWNTNIVPIFILLALHYPDISCQCWFILRKYVDTKHIFFKCIKKI